MMKEYDEYERLITEISEYAIDQKIEIETDFISKIYKVADCNIKKDINKALELRSRLGYTAEEISSLQVYLGAGCQFFSNFKDKDGAYCVSIDITQSVKRLSLIKECETYDTQDSIFLKYPDLKNLISNNNELINISEMKICESSRILKFGNIIVKMNDDINPLLISYLKTKYPNNVLFVRIDNNNYGENTTEFINENILRSEQSNWYKNMLIYNNDKRLGEYSYPKYVIKNNLNKEKADAVISKMSGKDYLKDDIYILQTLFKRDNCGLLSGSLEELGPIDSSNTLISKYIHLTSNSEIGTDWNEGVLAHIDGAINVYFDENAKIRLSKKLNEKVPSNCRTHLFRIDNIPITELLPISKLFFTGIALVEEWESDSFKNCV